MADLGFPLSVKKDTQVAASEPHTVKTETIYVAGQTARDRGMKRGAQIAAKIRATVQSYEDHFASLGIDSTAQKQAARDSMQALRDWNPGLYEEISGIALGSGLQVNQLGLTIARTEVLTLAQDPPSECSTISFQRPGTTVSAQNWDWTVRFVGNWHFHRVEPLDTENVADVPGAPAAELTHAGFAEYGMPGKIGMNSAGLGVHLNLLKHRDDAPGGVPIHAVLSTILSRATTVDEALEIIRAAGTSASSMITLVSADRVVRAEISPNGVSELAGDGYLCYSNHFHAQTQADGAMKLRPTSDTYERLETLEANAGRLPSEGPATAAGLLPALDMSFPQPPLADPLDAGATLVTVQLDPAVRTITLSPGSPQYADLSRQVFVL